MLYIPLIYKATLSCTLRTQIVSGMWPIFIFIFVQKCIFLSLSWCYKLSDQKTNTLQSFSYLAELPKRPKQKKSCSKNWLIGQLCVKTGVHTNFVDIDLFYPLLILHAKNVKLQWKFAKFLSNQFVLQLPFFFVITYNFAFLRSYSRYSKALRCTFFGERKNLCSSTFVQLLLLNRVKAKWSKKPCCSKFSLHKFVHLKYFWTQFKNVQLLLLNRVKARRSKKPCCSKFSLHKFVHLKYFGPNSKTCTCEVRAAWGRVSQSLFCNVMRLIWQRKPINLTFNFVLNREPGGLTTHCRCRTPYRTY